MSGNTDSVKVLRLVWIIGILAITIIIWGVKAQTPGNCELLMCTKSDGSVAVASIAGPADVNQAQEFIASQCPGTTNVTQCNIECKGVYDPVTTMAYWTWKQCVINPAYNSILEFICDASVMNICTLGKDPAYPFN